MRLDKGFQSFDSNMKRCLLYSHFLDSQDDVNVPETTTSVKMKNISVKFFAFSAAGCLLRSSGEAPEDREHPSPEALGQWSDGASPICPSGRVCWRSGPKRGSSSFIMDSCRYWKGLLFQTCLRCNGATIFLLWSALTPPPPKTNLDAHVEMNLKCMYLYLLRFIWIIYHPIATNTEYQLANMGEKRGEKATQGEYLKQVSNLRTGSLNHHHMWIMMAAWL